VLSCVVVCRWCTDAHSSGILRCRDGPVMLG